MTDGATIFLLDTARAYRAAGLCVLPADLKLKKPAVSTWKMYQTRLPTEAEITRWFSNVGSPAMCMVCGAVSGNLEVLDFDCQGEAFESWRELVEAEAPGLVDRLLIERSQSGGRHGAYRCVTPIPGNLKIAAKVITGSAADAPEQPDGQRYLAYKGKRYRARQVGNHYEAYPDLIETRGESGLVLCAPSPGYTITQGSFEALSVVSAAEREILIRCAAVFNEITDAPAPHPGPARNRAQADGTRPGDDFNARGDLRPILEKQGWKFAAKAGQNDLWRRPGKDCGWSATFNDAVFYVFSANADPFEPNAGYSKFQVYTLLEHAGDHSAAARALAKQGFGTPPRSPAPKKQGKHGPGAAAAAPQPPPAKGGLPQIIVSGVQLGDLTAQGLSALERANTPPVIFVRSGSPCRIVRDEDSQPVVDGIDKTKMRARLAAVGTFYSIDHQGGYVGANPPMFLAENILAQGAWDFPPLVGIARSPILRRDGTICTTPGYDAGSKLYYCPDPGLVIPPIPENPSPDEVKAAKDAIIDLIIEFPFADAASQANALAILLSIIMRPMISGHVPLVIVDAPTQGTGKTLMVTVLGIVAIGLVCGESIPDKQNADEWRKKITSVLRKGMPLVLLDNVPDNSTIDAPPLAAMLTTHMWSDRLLNTNDSVQLLSRSIWVATGNNLRVAGDMPRRCYTVRMDANAERPWTRTGFRHADLEQFAMTNRGHLLAAIFTLIRSWFAAGKPKADVPAFGSFHEWAETIGCVLAHVGIEGFLGNLGDIRAVQDEDTLQWQGFFARWWEVFGDHAVTADDVATRMLTQAHVSNEPLPDVLLVNKDKGEGSLKRSIGRNLSRLTGRIFDGRKLCVAGSDTHRKVGSWRLRPTSELSSESVTPLITHNPATNPAEGDEQ